MIPRAYCLAFLVRSLSLCLPHTFFQPDEFFQAFEPAHQLVFGYGHLTWEWKDLPTDGGDEWWTVHIVGGRMRSWLWPGLYTLIYRSLRATGTDGTFLLTFAPRLLGVLVAASTDYATSILATRLLGRGSAAGALLLSLTSLFNAHLLPRALSTSPETLLTTLALTFYPFSQVYHTQTSMASDPSCGKDSASQTESKELDCIQMDRVTQPTRHSQEFQESFAAFVSLASLALCLRPTTLPLWIFLAVEICWSTYRHRGIGATFLKIFTGFLIVAVVFGLTVLVDYLFTGRILIPAVTFLHRNVIWNVSSFYGATNVTYHLVQSLPIMLFPVWWWFGEGFLACLLPTTVLPSGLRKLDRPERMRMLARALTFTVAFLSMSPHSEWRFLHPLLPALLIFALPSISQRFTPTILGCYRLGTAIRQYTRFGKRTFFLCIISPVLPWIYLNAFHGKSQVEVMNVLRKGDLGTMSGLVVLAPCHSIPWMSHLHTDIPGWFLTCEPPLQMSMFQHVTSQALFYARPVSYIQTVFPDTPVPSHRSNDVQWMPEQPSHIVLFGALLDLKERSSNGKLSRVREALTERGYAEAWYGWNGFDFAQDEPERRGGVRVWTLSGETSSIP